MVEINEVVYQFVKVNGPVLPVQVAKVIQTNIIFASAILADLLSSKRIKLSHAHIGSSKLYYISGQESKLYGLLYNYLNSKEKQATELLKSKSVLRERELEPWQRIAFRDLKDFAIPLTVKHDDGSQEVFWKYHMIRDEEAKSIITSLVDLKVPVEEEFKIEDVEETLFNEPIVKEETVIKEEIKSQIRQEVKPAIKEELHTAVNEDFELEEDEEDEEEILTTEKPSGNFYNKIKRYIEKQELEILNEETVKKGKEFDFIVNIPTSIGPLRYYIKSKDKKAINEADLSLAVSEAKHKNMPVILLSNGKLTKKALEFLNSRVKNQILFKKV